MNHLCRLSAKPLLVLLALLWNPPLAAQCRTIGFEADIFQPADDLPFRTQLQASQNVVFSSDNNNDLIGDAPAILEAVGVQPGECGNQRCGFQSSNGTQAFDTSDPNVPLPQLGNFFLRLTQRSPPSALLIDFTNPEGVSTASGEIWDLDAGERWVVEAFDSNNTLIAAQTSPRGQGLTFDSRPWRWTLSPTSACPIYKIRIRYIGAQLGFVGIAFDNLTFCDITPAFSTPLLHCVNQPLNLVAAAATTPPDHQWDLIPSDGSGTSDSALTGSSIHRCWGPTCTIPPPLSRGTYVIKHGIFSQCLPWQEQRNQILVVEAPDPDAGPDQTICAGEHAFLPLGCRPVLPLPTNEITWTPAADLTLNDSRCVSARPLQTTTYTVRERDALAGCTGVDSAVVEVVTKPRPRIAVVGSCCSRRLLVTGDDIDQVQWNTGETTSEIAPPGSGVYTVVARNQCGETSVSRTVDVPAGIRGEFSRIGAASGFSPPATWWIFDDDLPLGARPAYGATAYRLWIYSRFGTEEERNLGLVAQGENCEGLRNGEITWDGRINGNLVATGVYSWVLQLRNCDDCHHRCPRIPAGPFPVLGQRCEPAGSDGHWCNLHRIVRPQRARVCTRRFLGVCVRWEWRTELVTTVSKAGTVAVVR